MEIRKIEERDLPQLAALYEELGARRNDPAKMKEEFFRLQSHEECVLLGGVVDGQLLGSIYGIFCRDLFGDCRPFLVLENMIVTASARRQGVARHLLTAMEEEARRRGCYYMMLLSRADRLGAHALYKACGYEDGVKGFKKYLA
ncbi:GNAT family N-acetyltransferase [Azotosporobacter soli]|uniref:GNAT family N-acetyltransferase n=1 Tax=Azotosporobacter soli TaxID=3055040 RepID=UPI0031FE8D24